MCCSASECPPPPSNCFVSGAECFANSCDYHPLDCGERACIEGACAKSPLSFGVKALSGVNLRSQQAGDESFVGTITNTSAEHVTISTYTRVSVHVAYIKTAANRRVEPSAGFHGTTSRSQESIAALNLTTLRPGESIGLTIALVDIPVKNRVTRGFAITAPGRYTARFYYSYTGSDRSFAGVFHGVVHSNEVAFTVE
jgi:hypothetical protein